MPFLDRTGPFCLFFIVFHCFLKLWFVFQFEWIISLNEYFWFNFELNIELNHFLVRFNVKMNIQNVSPYLAHISWFSSDCFSGCGWYFEAANDKERWQRSPLSDILCVTHCIPLRALNQRQNNYNRATYYTTDMTLLSEDTNWILNWWTGWPR